MQLERLACSTRAAGVGVEESGVGVGPALSPASGRVHGPGAGSRPEPAQRPGTARRHETEWVGVGQTRAAPPPLRIAAGLQVNAILPLNNMSAPGKVV